MRIKPQDVPAEKRRRTRKLRTEKVCNVCGALKQLDAFHRNSYAADGRTNTCKPCGNKRSNAYIKANRSKINKQFEKAAPRATRMLKAAKIRSAREGVQFSLTKDWFLAALKNGCEVTGYEFDLSLPGDRKRMPFSPSIDRKDAGGDYSEENCRLVALSYNLGRSDFGDDAMVRLARGILGLTEKVSPSMDDASLVHQALH